MTISFPNSSDHVWEDVPLNPDGSSHVKKSAFHRFQSIYFRDDYPSKPAIPKYSCSRCGILVSEKGPDPSDSDCNAIIAEEIHDS